MCICNRPVKTSNVYPYGANASLINRSNTLALDSSALESTRLTERKPVAVTSSSTTTTTATTQSAQRKAAPRSHIIIQHHYHDHSKDARSQYQEHHPARGGVVTPFPLKLHEMLSTMAANGQEDIVSWQPHGRSFIVHKPQEFAQLLPMYFKLSKIPSFQRQLNLYGFQRLTRGKDKGGYYHELFLRGRVFLAHNIQRFKVKGTGARGRTNPDQEPDLWSMSWLEEEVTQQRSSRLEEEVNQQHSSTAINLNNLIEPLPLPACSMTSSFQFPLQMTRTQPMFAEDSDNEDEDDVLCGFDTQPLRLFPSQQQQQQQEQGLDALLASEADHFFDGFNFPEHVYTEEIENDNAFGDLLEQMIA